MLNRSLRLVAAIVTMSLASGCGHLGKGLGSVAAKVAAGVAVAAAASVVNSAVNGDHHVRFGSADERAAIEEAHRMEAAAKLRDAEAAYAESAAPVPTF